MFTSIAHLKFHKYFILFTFIILSVQSGFSQFPVFSRESRLIKAADKLYQDREYFKAITKYREYISKYEGDVDIWYKIAISYKEMGQPDRSELYYSKIISTNEQANPIVHLSMGQVLMMQGKYDQARTHFQRYNELLEYNDQLAMRYISSIENIERFFTDSSFFKKANLPINSEASEYSAASFDNTFYFLSNRNTKSDYNLKYSSDLFTSKVDKDDMIFETPKKVSGPANTRFGEIGYAIVPLSNEIYICRYEPGKLDEYSLGYSLYKAFIGADNSISKPEKFKNEKFKYAIAYPTLSFDGKFLLFASDAPGGFGGWDLYRAEFSSAGFTNIQNLGEKVNSAGDELYPYLLNDSIIFYATDGQGGLGGFDIYSKNLRDGNEYARNLGFPINSNSDDYGIYFETGLSGYFTSNRDGGMGSDDIYRFSIDQLKLTGEVVDELNGENLKNVNIKINRSSGKDEALALADNGKLVLVAKPGEELEITVEKEGYEIRVFTFNTANMTFIGNHSLTIGKLPVVKMAKQTEPLAGAFELSPELIEKTQELDIYFATQIALSKSRLRPDYLRSLYPNIQDINELYDGKYYQYIVGKNSDYFLAKEIFKSLKGNDVEMVAFENGNPVKVMKALKAAHVDPAEARDPQVHEFIDKTTQKGSELIFYGLDLFRIPDGFEQSLNATIEALQKNPEYFLEIAAHTDKRGSDMYNRALSEERAKFLLEYLISKGISEKRIIAHGIGEKQLKKYCQECTEADHEQNRRAELILRVYKE